jgi:hypothetical protein
LTLQWLLTGAAVVVALASFAKARRLAKRLERLTESYWELRYEHGQLRARVNRLDPDQTAAASAADASDRTSSATHFVPLSSLKRQG